MSVSTIEIISQRSACQDLKRMFDSNRFCEGWFPKAIFYQLSKASHNFPVRICIVFRCQGCTAIWSASMRLYRSTTSLWHCLRPVEYRMQEVLHGKKYKKNLQNGWTGRPCYELSLSVYSSKLRYFNCLSSHSGSTRLIVGLVVNSMMLFFVE